MRRRSYESGAGCVVCVFVVNAGSWWGIEKRPLPYREADGSRHFASRLASKRLLWGSCAQERPRAAAG